MYLWRQMDCIICLCFFPLWKTCEVRMSLFIYLRYLSYIVQHCKHFGWKKLGWHSVNSAGNRKWFGIFPSPFQLNIFRSILGSRIIRFSPNTVVEIIPLQYVNFFLEDDAKTPNSIRYFLEYVEILEWKPNTIRFYLGLNSYYVSSTRKKMENPAAGFEPGTPRI